MSAKLPLNILISDLEREFSLLVAKLMRGKTGITSSPDPMIPEPAKRPTSHFGPWLRSIRPNDLLALPFIYGMIFPLLILDLCVTSYQAICFRLFGIERVGKSEYIRLERHQLRYLNWLERFNCDYCGYANGLVAFTREVLARTEQYFCPIKHAGKVLGVHERYALFMKPGDSDEYDKQLAALRSAVAEGS